MSHESGQAMAEALALMLALSLALLVPVDAGRPIATVLLEAIAGLLRAQSFVLSIV